MSVPAERGADAPYRTIFPRSHGIPRVDDRRIVSGIVYVVEHGLGKPIMMLPTEGQMSDRKGADLLFSALPRAKELLAD